MDFTAVTDILSYFKRVIHKSFLLTAKWILRVIPFTVHCGWRERERDGKQMHRKSVDIIYSVLPRSKRKVERVTKFQPVSLALAVPAAAYRYPIIPPYSIKASDMATMLKLNRSVPGSVAT